MNIFVTVLTLAAVFASSDAGPQGRIINGRYAGKRRFPFHVGISAHSGMKCGGVIISNYWVLTAGHCVSNLPEVTLHIGSTNFSAPELTLTVTKKFITVHPDYDLHDINNDIALLNTTYIEFTKTIRKVFLPSKRYAGHLRHRIVTAIGWGLDETGVAYKHNLKFAFLRVMSSRKCRSFYEDDGFDAERTICAMRKSSSTCDGDSGGPLIMKSNRILVGISTFGKESCPLGYPVGFARITYYRRWIKTVSGIKR